MPRAIIYTDLDGTLLDHASYSYEPALPAIAMLKEGNVPIVLASSKTAAEIAVLHEELELGETPAIVENGAGLFLPSENMSNGTAPTYERLRGILNKTRTDMGVSYVGFGDMSAAAVSELTGLDARAAQLSKQRHYSEPGLFEGTGEEQAAFVSRLADEGVFARQGGRFLTLSFGGTKADQMQTIQTDLDRDFAVALGDAPNDIEMLEAADLGYIIHNDHGADVPTLKGEQQGRIFRTQASGPEGWKEAIFDFLRPAETKRSIS